MSDNFKPGKKPHVFDERTILFSNFMDSAFDPPSRFDFDKGRLAIPLDSFGSTRYRCDVIGSTAHQLLRFGRIDQKRTLLIRSAEVANRYKKITGTKASGDENDTGLAVLDVMKLWQKDGWRIHDKNYKIALYGEIEPNEREKMRSAVFFFRGIHIGLMIPSAVRGLTVWDYNNENGEDWKPGEIGVLGYCKAYHQDSYEILLAGKKIRVSNEFVEKYSDECWVSMEKLEFWDMQILDMTRLFSVHPWLNEMTREEG